MNLDFLKTITQKQWLIIAIVVVAIIIVIILIRNSNKKPTTTITTVVAPPIANIFPIKLGSRGNEVSRIQTKLNSLGAKLDVDGIWGPLTQAAVLQYFKITEMSQEFYNANV